MEVQKALAQRRSCRAFSAEPVDDGALDRVLRASRRAPSAGNTGALELLVLVGADETAAYWDVTLPAGDRRDRFGWPRLLDAPVLVVPYVRAEAYVERYAERDKAGCGLGAGPDRWAVPYWWVDGGAAVMAILVAATDEGLGSLLFGQFDHAAAVAERFGVPSDRSAVGTIALGHPHPDGARRSASIRRARKPFDHTLHRGSW